jgi:drug/metabolite transporter (DMT)-like permease
MPDVFAPRLRHLLGEEVGERGGRLPLSLNVGIGLALLCAAVTQLGFLCKHKGANTAPRVELQRPLSSARALLACRWFRLGLAIAAAAWVLHVAALAVAPLSVVQAVLSTGVVILAVLGDRLFGCRVSGRQWAGAGMTALGLLLLVVTLPRQGTEAAFAAPALLAFELGMLAVGSLLVAAPKLGTPAEHHAVTLGAASGVLFGVSDVAVKALTGTAAGGPLAVVASPWLGVAVLASCVAFLASARGFQEGDAVPVIASTSTAANVTCILGGILVFGDALAGNAVLVTMQILAFVLVAAAALLMPAGHGRATATAAA